jgi:hypothetical protein
MQLSRRWFFLLGVVGAMALAVRSADLIPVFDWWGLDLHNLYVFHECDIGLSDIYEVGGPDCGDVGGRGMVYPPLLYVSFAWLRLVSFDAATWIWGTATVIAALLSGFLWLTAADRAHRPAGFVFWIVLCTQFPMLFALERGNNDIVVLVLWSWSFLFFRRERFAAAGAVAAVSATYKVYPSFGVLTVVVALMVSRHVGVGRFIVGAGIAAVSVTLVLFAPTVSFALEVLPDFGEPMPPLELYSHAVPGLWSGWIPLALMGLLVAIWASVGWIGFDPAVVFAGALAITTYLSPISWDYNLLTVYPLLLVVFLRAYDRVSVLDPAVWLLALGLFTVTSGRGVLSTFDPYPVRLQIVGQLVFIAASAFVLNLGNRPNLKGRVGLGKATLPGHGTAGD